MFSDRNGELAKEWVARWANARIHEADVSSLPKYFITFPFPYVNGAPHVGHAFSAFRVDCMARYQRLLGKNVLFPQGFHATGEPIVGVMERLKKGDASQVETLKRSGASDADIESFKQAPENIVVFWQKRWIEDLTAAGMSIDWSRKFTTTDLTPAFSRFISWQYRTLKELGYIAQGSHPVIWCPHDQSPTGDHDRLIGEGESPQEWSVVLFDSEHGKIACATLRPETIFGVTNLWKGQGPYVRAKVDDAVWIIAHSAIPKLEDQLHSVTVIGEVDAQDLIEAIHPLSGEPIPIIASSFVDMDAGSGLVMSVPAHAPYDYLALTLSEDGRAKDALASARSLITLKEVPEGMLNAKFFVEKEGISALDDPALDQVTAQVYRKEFHQGVPIVAELEGLRADAAKAHAISLLADHASSLWEMTGQVVCRCTTPCRVKIVEDQWFLRYNDAEWKERSKAHIASMSIFPEEARSQFLNTVDWLDLKACARKSGLGTRLPFDTDWIVETLSDSTLYMAYYTISRHVNEGRILADEFDDAVFDYIFRDGERPQHPKLDVIEDMKRTFVYFYPVDMRGSGKDLMQNHLTFFIMQHVAMFSEEMLPRGISANGFVNVEGEKMAKSKGNIIPLRDLCEKHGPDFVRINIVSSAEGLDDANWAAQGVLAFSTRVNFMHDLLTQEFSEREVSLRDRIMLHRIEACAREAKVAYDRCAFRTVTFHSFFSLVNALRSYVRTDPNKQVVDRAIRYFTILNAPLMPFVCAHFAKELGIGGIEDLRYPAPDDAAFDPICEAYERLVDSVRSDLVAVKELVARKGESAQRAVVGIAPAWMYGMLARKDEPLAQLMQDPGIRENGAAAAKLYARFKGYSYALSRDEECEVLEQFRIILSQDVGIEVVFSEHPVKQGIPGKPSIVLE